MNKHIFAFKPAITVFLFANSCYLGSYSSYRETLVEIWSGVRVLSPILSAVTKNKVMKAVTVKQNSEAVALKPKTIS